MIASIWNGRGLSGRNVGYPGKKVRPVADGKFRDCTQRKGLRRPTGKGAPKDNVVRRDEAAIPGSSHNWKKWKETDWKRGPSTDTHFTLVEISGGTYLTMKTGVVNL